MNTQRSDTYISATMLPVKKYEHQHDALNTNAQWMNMVHTMNMMRINIENIMGVMTMTMNMMNISNITRMYDKYRMDIQKKLM